MADRARRLLVALAFSFACAACAASEQRAEPATTPRAAAASSATPPRALTSATAAPPLAPASTPVVHHGITWYRDAPQAAFERARRENKLVVVDLWAAWCHTCLSMQEYVLTADKLGSLAQRFVFLSIDTERAENAEFLQKLTLSAWPTFYVLSPTGAVRGRWIGAATPGQFTHFLADGARVEELAAQRASGESDVLSLLAASDELAASGRYAEATAGYERVLERAPRSWPRRADALVARVMALKKAGRAEACSSAGLGERPSNDFPVSLADFAATLLDCAGRLPPADPRVAQAQRAATAMLEPLCTNGHAELTPDDRGDACGTLIGAHLALGDKKSVERTALTRLAVLEAAAAGMPDDVAAMYDFARSDTLVKLGRGAEAIELLRARERALPQNYNPPHQLARVYKALEQWDAGLSAIERALALAYGPRRVGFYGLKAELLLGKGEREQAIVVLAEQLSLYEALPEGQRRPEAETKVRAELARLRAQ